MKLDLLWTVLGMLAVTYSVRVSFGVWPATALSGVVAAQLHYVPAAVLTALVAPMTLAPQGALDVPLSNAYLPACWPPGWRRGGRGTRWGAIVCGFVVYAGWRWLS